MNTEVNSSLLR